MSILGPTLDQEERRETFKIMAIGFALAALLCLPHFANVNNEHWPLIRGFPLGFFAHLLSYVKIYIHEFGHTIGFWFYGYIAFPSLNFTHGGGVTYPLTSQLILLHLVLYGLLGYAFIQLRGHRNWQAACVLVGIFHLATAHLEFHEVVFLFGGHLFEVICAGIFMAIAWLSIGVHSMANRSVNAMVGFFIIIDSFIQQYGLLYNRAYRHDYYNSNGRHAVGDLDRVSEMLYWNFSSVIYVWAAFTVVAVLVPVIFYIHHCRQSALSVITMQTYRSTDTQDDHPAL